MNKMSKDDTESIKKIITKVVYGIIALFVLILLFNLTSTVEKGTYQIKQAAITGKMSARMIPGIWFQNFGSIDNWPIAETYFFTAEKDVESDVASDGSIEVTFNDGSICNISGTARILLPKSEQLAISLVTDRGHKTYDDMEQKLIKPTIRNVLRQTANLMSATESYSEKRGTFVTWARDQLSNGLYDTETVSKKVKDEVTGEEVRKNYTIIKTIKEKDPKTGELIDTGKAIYQFNPLVNTGMSVENFEIKQFKYEEKVNKQISEQQNARMAVSTAKAKAQEAEQNKLTIEAQGKSNVSKAQYKELEVAVVATVQAQRDKDVATKNAEKKRDVAALERDAAKLEKERDILVGEGISTKKRLILAADGALSQKLEAIEKINTVWADAFAKRNVPSVYMEGGGEASTGGTDSQFKTFMNMMNASTAKQLSVDMSIPDREVTK